MGLTLATQCPRAWQLRVMGCRCGYVGTTTGVPQIAAKMRRRSSRQHWAKSGGTYRLARASGVPSIADVVETVNRPDRGRASTRAVVLCIR